LQRIEDHAGLSQPVQRGNSTVRSGSPHRTPRNLHDEHYPNRVRGDHDPLCDLGTCLLGQIFFIEGSDAPKPGLIAADLTSASPPASQNEFWTTGDSADILTFQILDFALAPMGLYTPQVILPVVSATGAKLDGGQIFGWGAIRATMPHSGPRRPRYDGGKRLKAVSFSLVWVP
jgi:hypothetical protein